MTAQTVLRTALWAVIGFAGGLVLVGLIWRLAQ